MRVETLANVIEGEEKGSPFHNLVDIDFISIDTEGTELDVLKGFNFDKYVVKLFIVENNYNDENIEIFMREQGYVKHQRYKINDFYFKCKSSSFLYSGGKKTIFVSENVVVSFPQKQTRNFTFL